MIVLRRWVLALAAASAVALVACPGPTFVVQQYRGPQRPAETVAILRVNGDGPARLLYLDGEDVAAPIASDGRLHIEMLPGRHTVVVANVAAPGERFPPLVFEADPGRVYRVAFVSPQGPAHVIEVDRGSDAPVRDVTLSAPEATPAPPPPPPPPPPVEDAGAPVEEPSAPVDPPSAPVEDAQ